MNTAPASRAPWHLWVVGIVGLLWNGFGATDYTMTQLKNRAWFDSMGFGDKTADALLAFMETSPAWADAAWACGVWGAVIGCVLLLLRNRIAVAAFAISLLGVVVSMIWQAQADYPPELAEMGNSPMMYIVLAIAVALLAYAWTMRKRGVLR